MNRKLTFLAVLICIATAIQVSFAEKEINVTGDWDVLVRMPDKNVTEHWTVMQQGDQVTGTAKGPRGELKVAGHMVDRVWFRVDVKEGSMSHLVRATVDDNNNEMDGSITIGDKEFLWSAKRSKT